MSEISNLEPSIVWGIFDRITQIPRPSKKEEQIAAYIKEFATEHNLAWRQDAKGNIVVIRPGAGARGNRPPLILQSHMDMVCEKDPDVVIDFDHDPIDAYVEGGWVKARGTTLGADCGIGMALQMAALIAPELSGSPIEALFTVDEEQGLSGAQELGSGMLTGNCMINLDSEDEGEIFIGCAGGIDTIATFEYTPVSAPVSPHTYYTLNISGLRGGHSGDDIDKGRANSNKLLIRILWEIAQVCDLKLISIDGGNLRNAIPRQATATIGVPSADVLRVTDIVRKMSGDLKQEYTISAPELDVDFRPSTPADMMIPLDVSRRLLESVFAAPNGVISMSSTMDGLVETSTNLASIKMSKTTSEIVVVTSQRSSVESAKHAVATQIECVFRLAEAKVAHSDGYPGWKPNPKSPFLDLCVSIYSELFGQNPKVKAIHAGLECGLFLIQYPHLDMISIGPTLRSVHSPTEKLEISSVERSWRYLNHIIQKY